jgi:hypothetical protein
VTPRGKVMTDAVNAARVRPGRAIRAKWEERDFEELARLVRKFAADIEGQVSISHIDDHLAVRTGLPDSPVGGLD